MIGRFLAGAIGGFSLGLVVCLGIDDPAGLPGRVLEQFLGYIQFAARSADTNLQGSVPFFLVVLSGYAILCGRLGRLLAAAEPPLDLVVRVEQLIDLCASLFFGIGVIWTAIGMRGALLSALGDTDDAAALGAMGVLQRLVDGGILLALSSTIVGGAGGYLMRAMKHVLFGRQLTALYMRTSALSQDANLEVLERIERHLASGTEKADMGEERT